MVHIFSCDFANLSFEPAPRDPPGIATNFPQAAPVEYRMNNSGTWNERLGSYAMSWNGDRSARVAAISKTAADAVIGRNALVGINLNEGKVEIYRPTLGVAPDDAKLAGIAGNAGGGITMSGGANITAADVGSTLIVNGNDSKSLGSPLEVSSMLE